MSRRRRKVERTADRPVRYRIRPVRDKDQGRRRRPPFAVMIPTTVGRSRALQWNLSHLLKHVPQPFDVYVFNDGAGPLQPLVNRVRKQRRRSDVRVQILNENGRVSKTRVGCGGARHHLFKAAKRNGHTVIASIDDDMQVTEGWYEAVMEAVKKHPEHSVFTTLVLKSDGDIYAAGSRMEITDDIWLKRNEIREVRGRYHLADWTPGGCTILCRQALEADVFFPPVKVIECEALFSQLREKGLNETVVATGGKIIHKVVDAPHVDNFRTVENLQAAAKYIWSHYGINVVPTFKSRSGIPDCREGMMEFVR